MIPEEGVGNPGQVGFISLVAVHQEADKWGQLRIPGKVGSRSLRGGSRSLRGRLEIPHGVGSRSLEGRPQLPDGGN